MSNFGAFFFEAGDSVDGLYQAKWYSHDSFEVHPLGLLDVAGRLEVETAGPSFLIR